ncbi:MAG TPA: bifunctional metallophosphatase/5'-nucleotidase [Candidatus Aphodomonas merdavium]|nr:bifunctional metallophosphatase/5'-nucleotidase [Candidatus Aphodomonas merdavium]
MLSGFFQRVCALFLLFALLVCAFPAACAQEEQTVTILFTHDLHAHLLPFQDADGSSHGGFARLYTLLRQQREAYAGTPVITVDAGDFSMGSLFHTVYAQEGLELRSLGAMGYDAATFGNHEYDFRKAGLAQMLQSAAASGDALPQLVIANYLPNPEGSTAYTEEDAACWEAFSAVGVKEYTVIEKEGVRFAVFGIIGEEADTDAPLSGMVLEDPVEAAQRVVSEIEQNEDVDFVICLSHSGTDYNDPDGKSSEDAQIAEAVDGIDVIISGHSHSTLEEPLNINGTLIVSSGYYGRNLGELRVRRGADGEVELVSYELLAVDDTVAADAQITALIEHYEQIVAQEYLSSYEGMEGFNTVLAESAFALDSINTSQPQGDRALGSLISDAYRYAMDTYAGVDAEGQPYDPVDVAVVATGVVRNTFPQGPITVSQAFDVLSLGMGADGTAGYPLVSVYLTGEDLKKVLEIDGTISMLMPAARMFGSGIRWEINEYRMLMNRVALSAIVREDGEEPIDDDTLYHAVTGQYACQMLGSVTELSKGLIRITLRDRDGNPIEDDGTFDGYVVHQQDGSELKEWYALAAYLRSFDDEDGNGTADVPEHYAQPTGAKRVYRSLNPVELFKNANVYTYAALALVLLVIAAVALLVRAVVRRKKRRARQRRKFY